MTDEAVPPLEEDPAVADAIEDDVAVSRFITGGGPDADTPVFREPAGGANGEPEPPDQAPRPSRPVYRTGADQPWDPEDLAVAEGRDPTPANIERARRELERDGAAAIERTVP
jgi:hypothetical protein